MPRRPVFILPLLLMALIVMVALLTMLSPERSQPEPFANRSIYNNAPSGYKAWYLANRKAGLPMTAWERSFSDLDQVPEPATMLIVEPFTVAQSHITFGRDEVNTLLTWVSRGNTLVLLDDFKRYGSEYFLQVMSQKVRNAPGSANLPLHALAKPDPLLASFLGAPLRSEVTRRFEPGTDYPVQVLLADGQNRPLIIRIGYQKGSLILGTPVDLASNKFLPAQPENDNFQFLSNLLLLEKKPVFINEFVHGYAAIDNILAYYQQKTPLGGMLVQLFFAFLLVLWLSFFRWTRPPEDKSVPGKEGSLGAFINSLAGVYYRNRAGSLALGPQLDQIDRTLKRRYRVTLQEEETARLDHLLQDLFADYSSKDESPGVLIAGLKKAREITEQQAPVHPRELLRLSRQLAFIQERLRHGA